MKLEQKDPREQIQDFKKGLLALMLKHGIERIGGVEEDGDEFVIYHQMDEWDVRAGSLCIYSWDLRQWIEDGAAEC